MRSSFTHLQRDVSSVSRAAVWSARWRRLLLILPLTVLAGEAALLISGLVSWREALVIFVVLEGFHIALILGSVIGATVLTIRRCANEPGWTAFKRSYYQLLPAPIAWVITRELGSLLAVFTLLGRAVYRAPSQGIKLGYNAGRGRVFAIILGAVVLEIIVLHHVIPWPMIRLVHDIVGIYSLVIVLGYWAVPQTKPHLLFPDQLVLRSGHDIVATINWQEAKIMQHKQKSASAKLEKDKVLYLPNGRGITNLTIQLAAATSVRLGQHVGMVKTVHLGLDKPATFNTAKQFYNQTVELAH